MVTEQIDLCQSIQQNIKTLEAMCLTVKGYFDEKTDQKKEQEIQKLIDIDKPCENTIKEQGEVKFKGKTIRKNKKCNTWYTRFRLNGKQEYISAKTQKECLIKLKQKMNIIDESEKAPLLKQWYDKWLELFKVGKVKEITIKGYEKILRNIPKNIVNKNIRKITTLEIQELLNSITAERTRQTVYELLFSLFTKAVDFEILSKNIMRQIEKPKHVREKGIALDTFEQKRFVETCTKNRWGDLYLLILYQGFRIGEVLGLTIDDLNFDNNTISVNKSYSQYGHFDTTKNEQSNRTIQMFEPTIKLLEKHKNKTGRIFNISYTIAREHFKEILKEANIKDISLHDLRHTFITNCKNAGIPEHIVQGWVGHQIGSKVTSSIYTHITEDVNLLNVNKLNSSFFYSNSTHE